MGALKGLRKSALGNTKVGRGVRSGVRPYQGRCPTRGRPAGLHEEMTKEEFEAALAAMGLNHTTFAKIGETIGTPIAGSARTVRRWVSTEGTDRDTPIPPLAVVLVEVMLAVPRVREMLGVQRALDVSKLLPHQRRKLGLTLAGTK